MGILFSAQSEPEAGDGNEWCARPDVNTLTLGQDARCIPIEATMFLSSKLAKILATRLNEFFKGGHTRPIQMGGHELRRLPPPGILQLLC